MLRRLMSPGTSMLIVITIAAVLLLAAPRVANAQCNSGSAALGFNALYGLCNAPLPQPGFTLVDATQYIGSGDVCQAISGILQAYAGSEPGGVIVDARGFGSGSSQGCSVNPWNLATWPASSVVLLPAGTITIKHNWTLPKDARVVGEGFGATTLMASSSFSDDGSGAMIEMGTATMCGSILDCSGVSIENLTLDRNNVTAVKYGILNQYAQELAYVRDVSITSVAGTGVGFTGLSLQNATSANSGVYWDLEISNVSTCLSISGTYDTRGVHGLNCALSSYGSGPGISIDSPNNSLEDIYISGDTSQEGIVIGANGGAPNNFLFNIGGKGLGNLIHISNQQNTLQPPVCTPFNSAGTGVEYNVCNTTILAVSKQSGTNTIVDDLDLESGGTSTILTDPVIGMYTVGESIQAGSNSIGYSRFTTGSGVSASTPTWIVGTASPSSCTGIAPGSIYSLTSGSGSTIYVCSAGSWTPIV